MTKKLLALLLTLSILSAFVSCGKTDAPDAESLENTQDSQDQQDSHSDSTTGHVHEFSDPTCTEPATCICGAHKGGALGHDFVDATCTTAKICLRCNVTTETALGHNYTAATCTSPQICTRCEDVTGAPLGHDYAEATCLIPKTCKKCQATTGQPMGHTYADNKCIRCQQIDPESLPTPLESLHVIDSKGYEIKSPITDTYGNTYNTGLYYDGNFDHFSVHYLNQKYTTFTGVIIAPSNQSQGYHANLQIYVDDTIVYSVENVIRETQKINFTIDVKNASRLKIVSSGNACIAIADAKLSK